jgi:hypothetical protein
MTTAAAAVPAGPGSALDPVPRSPGVATGPRLRLLCYEPDPDHDPPASADIRPNPSSDTAPPVVTDLRETPALRRRALAVLRLTLEALDGRRPLTQLAPHLDPSALRYVRAAHAQSHPVRTHSAQRTPVRHPSRLTSVHLCRTGVDAVEVAAVYRLGTRARALAARFEGPAAGPADDARRWRCVTLRLL